MLKKFETSALFSLENKNQSVIIEAFFASFFPDQKNFWFDLPEHEFSKENRNSCCHGSMNKKVGMIWQGK
jgi:hypothetical protein